jgi:CRISPR-associated endoribonuclease Cas6
MPAIVELRLRPDRPIEPTTRQLHGLACALFEDTADAEHQGQEKPFSVWPLRQVPGGWLLRTAWLPHGFPQRVLASCGQVRLGPAVCTVTDVALRPVTHAELASVPAIDGIRLTLLSPAYFSQNGTYVTQADPRLIAGSWRRRWNASLPPQSGLAVDAGLWRDIHLALHITGSGLHTETGDTGYRPQAGLVGTATLRLETGATPEARRAFGTLARFAEYCGTGAQVTHGFGATKVTLLHSSWPADTEHTPIGGHGEMPERREH